MSRPGVIPLIGRKLNARPTPGRSVYVYRPRRFTNAAICSTLAALPGALPIES